MLEIRNLHASVGDKEILRGVDLTVGDGEVHALMGPNGCGKSTLSNVLAGNPQYQVTEGSITFNGKDVLSLTPDARSHEGIFLSFQQPVEIPGVSMVNFMRAAINAKRKYQGLPQMNAAEFLKLMREKRKMVGMDSKLAGRSVNEGFSGGERKRNEIFQMAMLEPKLAILDETDSGLDVDALSVVSRGIEAYRKECDGALLMITHNTRILEKLDVDRTHVMVKGHLVADGPASLIDDIDQNGFAHFEQASTSQKAEA